MNIAVVDSRGIYMRPDTSLENENRDIYPHDEFSGYDYVPVVFARICKTGKCVQQEFADRYFDAMNFGILLFPTGLPKGGSIENTVDHTTLLPQPMYNKIVFRNENDNRLVIRKNGRAIFRCTTLNKDYCARMGEAICTLTRLTSVRIGDLVCVPLTPGRRKLWRRGEDCGNIPQIKAAFCENFLFDFNIYC